MMAKNDGLFSKKVISPARTREETFEQEAQQSAKTLKSEHVVVQEATNSQ